MISSSSLLFAAAVLSCHRASTAETAHPQVPSCTFCDGWNQWADQLQAEVEATGKCPTTPPTSVPRADGIMQPSTPYVLDSADGEAWGQYYVGGELTLARIFIKEAGKLNNCNREVSVPMGVPRNLLDKPNVNAINMVVNVKLSGAVIPPVFIRYVPGSYSDIPYVDLYSYYGLPGSGGGENTVVHSALGGDSGGYAWVCIESVDTPEGVMPGAATWSGSAFIHTEYWSHKDAFYLPGSSGLPSDIFVHIGDLDCAYPEDASWFTDQDYCYNWSGSCDGIDNDLDGVVDEGSSHDAWPYSSGPISGGMDNDGDGVVDCMDDWDGDGVANHEDEDVVDCCFVPEYGCE